MLCAPKGHVGESMYPRRLAVARREPGDYSSPTPPHFSKSASPKVALCFGWGPKRKTRMNPARIVLPEGGLAQDDLSIHYPPRQGAPEREQIGRISYHSHSMVAGGLLVIS